MDAPLKHWRRVAVVAVGGLRLIGFDHGSELLLVISASGKGVVDCRTGMTVARDPGDEDEGYLEAHGIGPLAGKTLPVFGVHGGKLPLSTDDGWSLVFDTGKWPATHIALVETLVEHGPDYDEPFPRAPYIAHKIASEECLRACGFSYTGMSLVIATPADITIYSRDRD